MAKVLITTVPFGAFNRLPLELLETAGIEYLINPHNKKITQDQLADLVTDFDVIIAAEECRPLEFVSRRLDLSNPNVDVAEQPGSSIETTKVDRSIGTYLDITRPI